MSTTLYDTRITPDRRNGALDVWLWVAQVLLAVFFLLAGYMLGRNLAALSIAAFVVWGRTSRVRISARRTR